MNNKQKNVQYAVYSIVEADYQPLLFTPPPPQNYNNFVFAFISTRKEEIKKEKPFYWYCVVGWLFVSLLGSLFHFTYHWLNCNVIVGLLVAVNESVFEHLKLLGLPIMIFGVINYLYFGEGRKHIIATTAALYSGVAFLLVFNVIVSQVGGFEELWFDILLFTASAFVAQFVGWYYVKEIDLEACSSSYYSMLFIDCLLFATICCHLAFTDSPPQWAWIFEDPSGFYGRPSICSSS